MNAWLTLHMAGEKGLLKQEIVTDSTKNINVTNSLILVLRSVFIYIKFLICIQSKDKYVHHDSMTDLHNSIFQNLKLKKLTSLN